MSDTTTEPEATTAPQNGTPLKRQTRRYSSELASLQNRVDTAILLLGSVVVEKGSIVILESVKKLLRGKGMKLGLIVDETLLSTYRTPGCCEWCRRPCRLREPHHVFGKGARSWKRIDLPMFLMCLGSIQFECKCHQRMTNGCAGYGIGEQLRHLAYRDGTTPEAIRDEHDRILRTLGKGGSP